jgi:hypothetical protein
VAMSKKYQYDIPQNEIICHILHTSHLRKSLDFYKLLGINFVRDENNLFVKYVARPNKTCVFELYLAGDAVKSSPNPLKLAVNNLEEKVSSFGNLAQIQKDGSYLISDPDLRLLQVYDVKHLGPA